MTTAPTPTAAAAPPMAHTPDSQPAQAAPTEATAHDDAASRASARPRLRDQISENPLLSLFGAVFAGIIGVMGTVLISLMVYTLGTVNDRFSEINDRLLAQDAKIDEKFTTQDAMIAEKFTTQDVKIDEINLRLTALIAALNMTPEVDAALQGSLTGSTSDGSG